MRREAAPPFRFVRDDATGRSVESAGFKCVPVDLKRGMGQAKIAEGAEIEAGRRQLLIR
jgi:hypothetical protein